MRNKNPEYFIFEILSQLVRKLRYTEMKVKINRITLILFFPGIY